MYLTPLGCFVEKQLSNCNSFVEYVDIPLFVVMPNHIHLVVTIIDTTRSLEAAPYLPDIPDFVIASP